MTPELPVSFQVAPLPFNAKYTPNELSQAIASRLSLVAEQNYALFSISNTLPAVNQGPILLGGLQWYVWSAADGGYIREPHTAPTPNYPFRMDLTANQDLVFSVAGTLNADFVTSTTFDPNGVVSGNSFLAPIAGYYQINLAAVLTISSGTPGASTITISLTKNTSTLPTDTLSANLALATCFNHSTMLQLNAGDAISARITIQTSGGGTWRLNQAGSYLSGHRVQ